MKNLLFLAPLLNRLSSLLLLVHIFSCSSGTSELRNEDIRKLKISYQIDTVIVDSGDDFLFLKYGLLTSGASQDRKLFYNIDELGSFLEIIDLDSLVLKEKIPLEREGPDGVGPEHISNFQTLENGNLCFYNIAKITVLTPELKKVSSHYFYPEVFENPSIPEGSEIPPMYGKLDAKGTIFAGFNSIFFENEILGIALIDLEKNELKLVSSDKLDYLKALIYISTFGNARVGTGDAKYLDFFGNKLIISTSAKNEALIYDIDSDSLGSKSYHSGFTSDVKEGKYIDEPDSDLALKMRELEVHYDRLVYDESRDVFWRYSRESKSADFNSPTFDYVLTVFDRDLNQLHEEKLNVDWTHKPSIKFIKDGMLYTYVNIDDELAFVRLKPQFDDK